MDFQSGAEAVRVRVPVGGRVLWTDDIRANELPNREPDGRHSANSL
jgi:hypothetical protein